MYVYKTKYKKHTFKHNFWKIFMKLEWRTKSTLLTSFLFDLPELDIRSHRFS